ncbi:autotransporter domain-containing protein [Sphingomonas sp. DT-51]|uniref:autotransporter domain-containing protein n=1 Tax=Sphingomonas sp. DT-51 TaxID=3396165 RepID=UPI003F1A24E6
MRALLSLSTALLALPVAAQESPQAVSRRFDGGPDIAVVDAITPDEAVDPAAINGVGQIVVDHGWASGYCTGTLINPRTVLFASHCVNGEGGDTPQDPWRYGNAAGQMPVAFALKADNQASVHQWVTRGEWQHRTHPDNAIFSLNQVVYHPGAVTMGMDLADVQADIAIGSLDAPAKGIPTWTLLFSPLPAPAAIDAATGTGYHVTVTGYGVHGNGGSGYTGFDLRRRSAENMIGLLTSLDEVEAELGMAREGLHQNLYFLDFDDPRRRAVADINVFRDDALPAEGVPGFGDSGGPLILDRRYAEKTVIGVLSAGRWPDNTPPGSYGTFAFYQPLYLYWNYIVANNPYRYVGALAGDGRWSDPAHWQTRVDPAYRVIVSDGLVNALPDAPGAELAPDAHRFGQICDQEPALGVDRCYDVRTHVRYDHDRAVSAASDDANANPLDRAERYASGGALPAPTLANGLPGATGFVPDNVEPDSATHRSARYFDVTLSAPGTTTLDTSATVDQFTVAGSGARLSVSPDGHLTSLIEIDQLAGFVHVDGTLTTPGDYLLTAGQLSGSGRIETSYLTSVAGVIAPGKVGTIGTLRIGGNLVLASKSLLLIDVGAAGSADRVAVEGKANLGGTVALAPVAGHRVRAADVYTLLTADEGLTGGFDSAARLSAILTPTLLYDDTSVRARVDAGRYADVVASTRAQRGYAALLDRARPRQAALAGVYDVLDLQDAPTIQHTLEALAPRAEGLDRALGALALDNMARFYRARLAAADPRRGAAGAGQLTLAGEPIQLAATEAARLPGQPAVAIDSAATITAPTHLPDTVAAYLAAGYLDGSAAATRTALAPRGRDPLSGWYLAGGLEAEVDDRALVGLGLSFTRVTGSTAVAGQSAEGELYQGTLYGKLAAANGLYLDTQESAGLWRHATRRSADLVGSVATLRSHDHALAYGAEIGAGHDSAVGALRVGPRVALRASALDLGPVSETGGAAALRVNRRRYASVQGRAGVALAGGSRARPWASVYMVHDFRDPSPLLGGSFAAVLGTDVAFALPGRDRNWGELGAGIALDTGRVTLTLGADTTLRRRDVRDQAYRASVRVRF